MKILIPTQTESLESTVSNVLGRSNYFYIYDTETDDGLFYENSFIHGHHGAGVKTAEFILKQGTHVLLTPSVGEKALDLLLNTDVKIYQTNNKMVKENIHDFLNHQLKELY